ncbi:MAG TPA: hypothetical protein VGM67_11255 [Gemmatimonadaceae bacterium]|jgi:hypothetical protein
MSVRRKHRAEPTTDRRTPDERLEALVREPNHERSLRALLRIRRDLEETPEPNPAPWLSAARTLADRLIISENSLYYFAEIFTECMVFSASVADPELMRTRGEMDRVERIYGLAPGQSWPVDRAPAEWKALNDEWNARADAIVVDTLKQAGHDDLADVRANNLRDFDRRVAKGRIELFGEEEFDRY